MKPALQPKNSEFNLNKNYYLSSSSCSTHDAEEGIKTVLGSDKTLVFA